MADYSLKDEKRINTNGEWDKVTTHPNNEPIFRQNGHELVFEAANNDYLEIAQAINWVQSSEIDFEINVFLGAFSGVQSHVFSVGQLNDPNSGGVVLRRNQDNEANRLRLVINGKNLSGIVGTAVPAPDGFLNIKIKNSDIKVNGVSVATVPTLTIDVDSSFGACTIGKAAYSNSLYLDGSIVSTTVNNETFNPIDINSSGQIEGSNGTVATVNTSHASGLSYILGTVFQKSSFALVGNGTTQKIVGHLGTDLILTSTPLEGGFTLDSVIYNLTEGLGNKIKSTTGETATIQGFTGTGLNFGGWQKNGNVLEFDSANNDFIGFPRKTINGDYSVSVLFNFNDLGGSNNAIFGDTSRSNNYAYVASNRKIVLRFNSSVGIKGYTTTGALNNTLGVQELKIETVGSVLNIYVDNVLFESSDLSDVLFWEFNTIGRQSTIYNSLKISSFNLDDKTFKLREGSGNTTTSEDGTTTVNINTSHASGADILWEESKQKWIDYKI